MSRCILILLAVLPLAAQAQTTERYAVHQSVAVQVKNPNPMSTSRWTTVRTFGWGLVDMVRDGDRITYEESTCDIATSKVFGTTTEYSRAFIDSLGIRSRSGSLQGDRWVVGPFIQTIGAGDGQLPNSADDAVDTDGDGLPGVTVAVKQAVMGQGEVYVAQRTTNTLQLTETGTGWSGTVQSDVEEVVLDATTWWLKADRASRPHPDPSESTIEFVRVDTGTSCSDVLRRKDTLFTAMASR